jgi:uncharacterized protein (TIGR01777 family)
MKILIAGATGLIGRELVSQCLEERIHVNYLTTSKQKLANKEGYQGFYWDPDKGEIDLKAFEGVEAIVNLAGSSIVQRWTKKRKRTILQSRVEAAELIYTTLQKIPHTVTQYISASGISGYPSSYDQLYYETYEPMATTFLGEVVTQWEVSADKFLNLGIKVTKVRTGIVLSEQEGALPKLLKPIKMGFGSPLGSGDQWQSWIHERDIAGIYIFLLNNTLSGVFNAVSPNPVTNKRMVQILADHYNKSVWFPKVPEFILRLILGEMAAVILESQLVSSEKLIAAGFHFQFVNLEHAIEDLLVD